jgi:hypothetical protein
MAGAGEPPGSATGNCELEGSVEETDPLEEFIGAFESDVPDWADNHDKHLADIVMDTHDDESESR